MELTPTLVNIVVVDDLVMHRAKVNIVVADDLVTHKAKVNNVVADDLVMHGAKVSATMVNIKYSQVLLHNTDLRVKEY